ncbi:hypothetical protein LEN26_007037 [Aphanomyces euteiches]|nr:hypothetical protein LEN26_007037 [Aphanomyces euteiches]
MGAGGSALLKTEQQKPVDASDINDGDWEAAKAEIVRLRRLLTQYDAEESSFESPNRYNGDGLRSRARSDESLEGRTLWSQGTQPNTASDRAISPPRRTESSSCSENNVRALLSPPREHSSMESRQDGSWKRSSSSNDVVKAQESWPFHDKDDEKEMSSPATSLLDQIRIKVFERCDNLRTSFLKIDVDRSGYISEEEFRFCMANMGLELTDEQFMLLQASYPHKEAPGEVDKGIGYLEFVRIMTDELQYEPGAGEEEEADNYFRLTTAGLAFRSTSERPKDRQADLAKIRQTFVHQVFGLFSSMKEAFKAADRDGSGYIELNEFVVLLRNTLGIDADAGHAKDLLALFDTNNDGKLAYSEFVKCLQAHHTSRF